MVYGKYQAIVVAFPKNYATQIAANLYFKVQIHISFRRDLNIHKLSS